MNSNHTPFLVPETLSVRQVMERQSSVGTRVLFVVDPQERLLGAVSDGDIRKWILSGGKLESAIQEVYNRHPRAVEEGVSRDRIRALMVEHSIEAVPVISKSGIVLDVFTWSQTFAETKPIVRSQLSLPVVIMAGGLGTRLDPFTRVLPKPLIPIGETPVIEHIMRSFAAYGITEFFLTVNHKSRMIKSYFEDAGLDYVIRYVEEPVPLGTAGSLRLLPSSITGTFLCTNCDVLIRADLAEAVRFHQERQNALTLVASLKQVIIPYGVCEIENGGDLKVIREKPSQDLLINTGMYVLEPVALSAIPEDQTFDFPHLIAALQNRGQRVGVFPIGQDAWMDVGEWDEYRSAAAKLRVEA